MTSTPLRTGLLVDDDTLYLRTLQRSLARRGVETLTAT
ncbi:MAG: two-component system response regulator, partial [Xanthomonas perforans]|nr:two-component system response regulator [Xanthomonas perforans]